MTERPLLFSAPMVRALLDGSKTQTRRIVKRQPWASCSIEEGNRGESPFVYSALHGAGPGHDVEESRTPCVCPYGQPGDRLWVRETFSTHAFFDDVPPALLTTRSIHYWADGKIETGKGRPSIHMPRWASRILLEIVSVRVERLNDCSEADAKAEGVMQLDADEFQRPEERTNEGWALCPTCCGTGLHSTLGAGGGVNFDVDCQDCDTHLKLYQHLWESINGPNSWAANPWVWVVEFKRVLP